MTAHRKSLLSRSHGIKLVLAVVPWALAACHSDYGLGREKQPVAEQTSKLIIDQTNNPGPASVTGFYWIPPVIQTAAMFTTLDTTGGTNSLTVRIDRVYADNSTDAAAKATFTGTGITLVTGSSSTSFPGVVGPFYGANWAPGAGVASGQNYRVSVQALTPLRVLGVVDVQVVANAAAAAAVDRTRFTPLIVGATLPIVFRLENKDSDGDTVNNWKDNCPVTKNFNQLDADGDGRGNACQCLNAPNGTACKTSTCKTGETCSSGSCTGGSNTNSNGTCSTGNPCASAETCDAAGVCGGTGHRTLRTSGSCGTGNPCKTSGSETCNSSGVCQGGTNASGTTVCVSGTLCRSTETCNAGVCGGSGHQTLLTSGACTTGSACRSGETCNSSAVCSGGANKANGTACSDGNLCTPDTCQAGICTPGATIACSTDPQCHNAGTCITSTGLCPPIKADATTCTDGKTCTSGDVCLAGVCTGTVSCTPPTGASNCQVGSCAANGTCTFTNVNQGGSCNDGKTCTANDICSNGICTGTVSCAPPAGADVCQVGSCAANGTCTFTNVNQGGACNDGKTCTANDICSNGICTGMVSCTPLASADNCQTGGTCAQNGTCTFTNVNEGGTCTDHNPCTSLDRCTAGVCAGTSPTCSGDVQLDPSLGSLIVADVWGPGTGDIYVSGGNGTIIHRRATGAVSYASVGVYYGHLWGSSATDVYSVVQNTVVHSGGNDIWTALPATATTGRLQAVWGSSSSDIYAVGENSAIFHSTGNNQVWTKENSPASGTILAVRGSGATDVFAVGYDPSNGAGFIIHRGSNGIWQTQLPAHPHAISNIWAHSPNDIYAVGNMTILHSTGDGTWHSQDLPPDQSGTAINFGSLWAPPGGTPIFIAGSKDFSGTAGGVILKSAGTDTATGVGTWTTAYTGTNPNLGGLWGDSAASLWLSSYDSVYKSKITHVVFDGNTCDGWPDSTPCTVSLCDPIGGVVQNPVAGACDDGNPCTQADQCSAGACQPGTPLPDGTSCGNLKTCQLGLCAGKPFNPPSASSACTFNPATMTPTNLGVFSLTNTSNATVFNDIPLGNFVAGTTIIVGFVGLNNPTVQGDTYLRLFDNIAGEVASNDDACGTYGSRIVYTVPRGSPDLTARLGCYSDQACGGTLLVWSRLDSNGYFTDIQSAFDHLDGDNDRQKNEFRSIFWTNGKTSKHYTECLASPGCAVHFQGVARLPIPGLGNVLAIAGSGVGDIFFAKDSGATTNSTGMWHDHWSGHPNSPESLIVQQWSLPYYTAQDPQTGDETSGLTHVSGLQAIGQYLATVTQAQDELSDPVLCVPLHFGIDFTVGADDPCFIKNGSGSSVNRIMRVNPDLSVSTVASWEANFLPSNHFGSCAAATKTADGGFLFAVGNYNSTRVDIYRKAPDQMTTAWHRIPIGSGEIMRGFADIEFDSSGWTKVATMTPTPSAWDQGGFGGFQNCNLFSQVDGTLWLGTTDGGFSDADNFWIGWASLAKLDPNHNYDNDTPMRKDFPNDIDLGSSVGLFQDAGLDRMYLYTTGKWTANGQLGYLEFGSKVPLSTNQPTFQSSTSTGGESNLAIDGDTNTVASTLVEASPWWYINLGALKHVQEVKVLRSLSPSPPAFLVYGAVSNGVWTLLTDANNAQIYTGQNNDIFYNAYNSDGTSTTYQYIMIQQPYGSSVLQLADVQIWGE